MSASPALLTLYLFHSTLPSLLSLNKKVQSGFDIISTHRFPPEFLEPRKELCTTEKGFDSFFLQSHGGVSSPRNRGWGEILSLKTIRSGGKIPT